MPTLSLNKLARLERQVADRTVGTGMGFTFRSEWTQGRFEELPGLAWAAPFLLAGTSSPPIPNRELEAWRRNLEFFSLHEVPAFCDAVTELRQAVQQGEPAEKIERLIGILIPIEGPGERAATADAEVKAHEHA